MKPEKRFFCKIVPLVILTLFAFSLTNPAPTLAVSNAEAARQLVEKAQMTFDNFLAAPEMDAFRDYLKRAKGVFIAPQVLKGAFILGASGGSGVMVAKAGKGSGWSGPAFYTIGELSYGLQIGGEASEVVLLAMTERGVTAFLSNSLKLGADIGVAAGPVGIGAAAATANLSADIISFSRSKGAFGGIAFNGAVVATRDALNTAYYGKKVFAIDILVKKEVNNPQADKLLQAVRESTGKL